MLTEEEEDNMEEEREKPRVVEFLEDVSISSLQRARALVETLRDGSTGNTAAATAAGEDGRGGGEEGRKKLDANSAYLLCFQLLKQAGLEAELPRLVVFGQQSMGKTTLLDYIMGGPVGYSSTDTGTRQPVVIMLRPSETGTAECRIGGEKVELRELQRRMQQIMAAQKERISSEELEVELAVKNGVHAVFVDLPGIKDDSKAGAMQTRAVVKTYVQQNPNDLYILVKKASDDPANWPWSLREFILSPPPPEEKDTLDFGAKREAMNRQMEEGGRAVKELLQHAFAPGSNPQQSRKLAEFFSPLRFKRELNKKFQGLLSEQLGALERRLVRKRLATERRIAELEEQLAQQNPQSCREYIKLYLRELLQVVTELVSGNYTIIRLPESGDIFLSSFGGSLKDNLEDGHKLACELFPEKEHYDPEFLRKTFERFAPRTGPDGRVIMQPGQIVRYTLSKDESNMFGLIQSVSSSSSSSSPGAAAGTPSGAGGLGLLSSNTAAPVAGGISSPTTAAVAGGAGGGAATTADTGAATQAGPTPGRSSSTTFLSGKDATVTFYFRSGLNQMIQAYTPPPAGFRCWRRYYRPDGWVGLQPVELVSMTLPAVQQQQKQQQQQQQQQQMPWGNHSPTGGGRGSAGAHEDIPLINGEGNNNPNNNNNINTNGSTAGTTEADHRGTTEGMGNGATGTLLLLQQQQQQQQQTGRDISRYNQFLLERGEAIVKCLLGPDLRSAINPHAPEVVVALDELFTDAAADERTSNSGIVRRSMNLSTMQRISGEFAEMRLLNQLSLTHLGRWLKFHMCNIEPERKFSDHVLLQMMRSVRHVIDKADWEPLVADLLQANVRGGMLQLVRLAACAAAAALRRILRAASAEVLRQVRNGDLTGGLLFLANNRRFVEELDASLETYCRKRARECATAMRDLIFEQTHAIHFEMIEDFFDGCRRFETDFLGGSMMLEVTQHVKDSLAMRKQRLGIADVYARHDTGAPGTPNNMIYEEVRIQFWVVKMLLSAPLTTKLYMYFIKDIKDKSMHLASEEKHTITCESDLERTLQERMLCEPSSTGRALPRTDQELMEHFNVDLNKDELLNKLQAARRTEEYTKLALEGVGKLLQLLQKGRGVDFLARLEEASTGRPFAAGATSETSATPNRISVSDRDISVGKSTLYDLHSSSGRSSSSPRVEAIEGRAAAIAAATDRASEGGAAGAAATPREAGTEERQRAAATERGIRAREREAATAGDTAYDRQGKNIYRSRATPHSNAAAIHSLPPLLNSAAAASLRGGGNPYLLNTNPAAAATKGGDITDDNNNNNNNEDKEHFAAPHRLPSTASTASANGA